MLTNDRTGRGGYLGRLVATGAFRIEQPVPTLRGEVCGARVSLVSLRRHFSTSPMDIPCRGLACQAHSRDLRCAIDSHGLVCIHSPFVHATTSVALHGQESGGFALCTP